MRITGEYYPRFHLYIKETMTEVIFDLHLDQKKASYAGSNMHGGEYDGPAVEREMKRIKDWVAAETGYRAGSEEIRDQRTESADQGSKTKDQKVDQEAPSAGLFGGIF